MGLTGASASFGAPFGVELMSHFKTPSSVGVQEAVLVRAAGYFVMMNFGAWIVRVPADYRWKLCRGFRFGNAAQEAGLLPPKSFADEAD